MEDSAETKHDTFIDESQKAFKAEDARRETLDKKGEKIFAIIALLAGFHLFDIDQLSFSTMDVQTVSNILALLAFVALAASLIYAIRSTMLKPYESYPRGMRLRDTVDAAESDAAAKIDIGLFYLKAHDKNASINDGRAILLRMSIWWLTAGFLIALVSHILSKIRF